MNQLSENLRMHRKRLDMTQEEMANLLSVTPQTISKWERSETYPDILMLPALAHLFDTSVDALLGMEQQAESMRQGEVYTRARQALRVRDWQGAIRVYEDALRLWPGDAGLMCDLAMALGLRGNAADLSRAAELCSRVLDSHPGSKVAHTARAALCYLCHQMGEAEQASQLVRTLPHTRESREVIQKNLAESPGAEELRGWLYTLSTGEGMPETPLTP